MYKSSRSSTTNSDSNKSLPPLPTSSNSSSTSSSFPSLIPRLRWLSSSGSSASSASSRKGQPPDPGPTTASLPTPPLFPNFPTPPSFIPSATRSPPSPPSSISRKTLGGDGITDKYTPLDHHLAVSPFPSSPPPSIPLPPRPSSSSRSSPPSSSRSKTATTSTSSTSSQTVPTLTRPRQRTTSTSSVETIRPSRAVVMLDELTRTYEDLDVGTEIDFAYGSSSDLGQGSTSRSSTPVGVRKIPSPTAKVIKPPTTTVSTSTKAPTLRKSSSRISKHSSTKLQERKGKSTFTTATTPSSSSSSLSKSTPPSLTFTPTISTSSPSLSTSTPILHSSAQPELESGSSSSSMVTNPRSLVTTPTPPFPSGFPIPKSPLPPPAPSPPRKLTPTLNLGAPLPHTPTPINPIPQALLSSSSLSSGNSISVNLRAAPKPKCTESTDGRRPSQEFEGQAAGAEDSPFPSISRSVPRNAENDSDQSMRRDELEGGSLHSPFAFDCPPFEYQDYGDFSHHGTGIGIGIGDGGGVGGDGLTVRIFDEEEHNADPFRSGIAPPEVVVTSFGVGVGVAEWEKEQEQAILRAPTTGALQGLQLMPPFSDESSASSDDPFEFDARRRPWIPTRASTSGVARQTKVHRKVGADDLKMDVVFFRSRHQVFWDMDDQEYLICPAQLHLTLKNPLHWNQLGTDISMPEIYAIDLACANEAVPSILSKRDPDSDFSIRYTGSRATSESDSRRSSRKKKSTRRPSSTPPAMVPKRGICIDFDWEKLYSPAGGWDDSGSYSSDGKFLKGWFTDIWIPIPTRLFAKKETRTFIISSEMWFHRDANVGYGGGRSGNGGRGKKKDADDEPDGVFGLDAVMTVSHLWKEREMLNLW